MTTSTATIEALSEAIVAANTYPDEQSRPIVVALYDLLAQGEPVSVAQVAARTGLSEAFVLDTMKAWPGVYCDEAGRIVGFWGIAGPEMGIYIHAEGGKRVGTWCALDPFLIVPTIGRPARVEAKDALTGEPVTLTVTPQGITDLSPASAYVSFIAPTKPFSYDVIESFCEHVLYFTSRESAERWASERQDIIVLPASDAFEVGRRTLSLWRDGKGGTRSERRDGPTC